MATIDELNQKLNIDWPGSLWDEYGKAHCLGMLEALDTASLDALFSMRKQWSPGWRTRLASLLAFLDPRIALPLLRGLLDDTSDEVLLAAADSIRSMQAEIPDIQPQTLKRLRAIMEAATNRIDTLRAAEFLRQAGNNT